MNAKKLERRAIRALAWANRYRERGDAESAEFSMARFRTICGRVADTAKGGAE